jgi:two-component system sensor histidine kinase KdpD
MVTFPYKGATVRSVLTRSSRICLSAGAMVLLLAAAAHVRHLHVTTTALVLVLAVLCIALVWGSVEALVAALVAGLGLDYFFLPPYGFGIDDPQHWVDLFAFLATALATGQLSARVNRNRAEAVKRREEIEKLSRLSGALSEYDHEEAIVQRLAGSLLEILGVQAAAVYDRARDRIWRLGARSERIADGALRDVAASGNRFDNPDSALTVTPVHVSGQLAGSVGIVGGGVSPGLLQAAMEQVGAAIAKGRAAEEAKEAEIARRSEELKSAVFDALAHEARGPLGSIDIAATTLLSARPGDAAQQREMLGIIKEEVERIDRWLDEAARASRADACRLTPDKAPRDVAGALEPLRPLMGGRRIGVEIADSLPMADCDAKMIEHVLHLLLDNAMKYTPPGSPIVISASLDDDTPRIVVSVADAGPGVPDGEHARIFEKHYRGSRHRSSVPGTGLGLASAKHLVEAHGGEIWVTNRPAGGAAFHFSLPATNRVGA